MNSHAGLLALCLKCTPTPAKAHSHTCVGYTTVLAVGAAGRDKPLVMVHGLLRAGRSYKLVLAPHQLSDSLFL